MAESALLNPTFLFRFDIAVGYHKLKWTSEGLHLPEQYQLPCFGTLSGDSSANGAGVGGEFADVRMAWDESGLGFWVQTSHKRQLPWCRDSRLEDSDGLHFWIDTRQSPGIHRANRYCHRFAFTPFGGGQRRDQAVAQLLPIARARQEPNPVSASAISVFGKPTKDGYQLSAMVPASALTGYDPKEYPAISLWYSVLDRELGSQNFSLGTGFPCAEAPSVWGSARLVK